MCRKAVLAPGKGALKPGTKQKRQASLEQFVIPRAACSGLESSLSSAGPSGRTEEEEGEGGKVELSGEEGEGGKVESSGEEGEGSEIDARVEEGEGRQVETGEEGEEAEIVEEEVGEVGGGGGRSKPMFPKDHPFLVKLRDYLTSRHGKGRSPSEAAQISAEVSRYLFFSEKKKLDKNLLLNAEVMNAYLREVERSGLTPSTERAKLNRLRSSIEFLCLGLDTEHLPQVAKIKQILSNWISVLGKEAKIRNRIALEEASENPVSLDNVDEFVKLRPMKELIQRLFVKAEKEEVVQLQELRSAEVWLAGCLLLTNHQRPGAVANAKTVEWASSKASVVGRKEYRTFFVADHKTATTGRAKLTVSKEIGGLLDKYVTLLRPLLSDSPLLFPNQSGKPIDHLSRHLHRLGKKYAIEVPTASASRRAAATAISKAGSEADREAVATMMSHSQQTQQRYYAMTKGRDVAVKGFLLMESLRQDSPGDAASSVRVRYSEGECESILLYFQEYIESGSAPPINVCHDFLRDHPMNREAKQVRDKVRNLIKHHVQ